MSTANFATTGMPRYQRAVQVASRPTRQAAFTGSRFQLLVWCLFVAMSPFYIFSSGLPQPADMLLVFFFLIRFLSGNIGFQRDIAPVAKAVIAVLVYFALLDLIFFMITSGIGFARFTSFYVFNLIAVWAFATLQTGERAAYLKYTITVMILVVFGLAVYTFATVGLSASVTRQIATFNNPNQLAYYCVFCGTFVAIASRFNCTSGLSTKLIVPFYICLIYMTGLAASRAGMAAVVFSTVLGYSTKVRHLVFGVVVISIVFAVGAFESSFSKLNRRIERSQNMSIQDQFMKRGFSRIFEYPEYLLFGAGEGDNERFFQGGRVREFHSTPGNIIFSYGIVGTTLCLIVIFKMLKLSNMVILLFLAPPMLYGLTHNGLRQVELWLLPVFLMFGYLVSKQVGVRRFYVPRQLTFLKT